MNDMYVGISLLAIACVQIPSFPERGTGRVLTYLLIGSLYFYMQGDYEPEAQGLTLKIEIG